MEYVILNNDVKMPKLGYEVYQIDATECERCVLDAVSVGYRSIDTAQAYGNEEGVGNAIMKKYGVQHESWGPFAEGRTGYSALFDAERCRGHPQVHAQRAYDTKSRCVRLHPH